MLRSLRLAAAAALVLTLAAPLVPGPSQAKNPPSDAAADVKIVNGWIEMPLWDGDEPPVYFTIMNKGSAVRKIVGASSPHCKRIELRRSALVNGTMASEKIDDFDVPGGGGAVAFTPRGLFLRMIEPKPMADGDKLSIELEFGDGGKAAFEAVVKEE